MNHAVHGVCALLLAWLVTGCEPDATPLPAFLPADATVTAEAAATPAPVRYALSPEAAGYAGALIAANPQAQVTLLDAPPQPDAILAHYDLVAGLGVTPGWQQSPIVPVVSLALAPSRPPFTDTAIAEAVRGSIDATALVAALDIPGLEALTIQDVDVGGARQALANAGWPDGFDITLAHTNTPGAEQVAAGLRAIGLNVALRAIAPDTLTSTLAEGRADLALFAWTTTAERDALADIGADAIDLFRLPIRYLAADGVDVTFTEGGWPAPSR